MSKVQRYDVAVIGAGPAGSRTARLLAERGYHVALMERDAEVGRPVHCTGIVSRQCLEQYDLPLSLALRSVSSFVVRSPGGRGASLKRASVQAYVLDRVALDRHLAAEAQGAGAELMESTAVDSLQWHGSGVDLTALSPQGPVRMTARVAVLATGFGAPLARTLGFSSVRGVISGCQAVVTAPGVQRVEVFTGSGVGRGGYGWLVPWKPGTALAGVLTRSHAVQYMEEHIQRLQEAGRVGEVNERFHCRPVPLGLPGPTVADGVVAVGDVVNQVKATTGGGIYFGLLGADAAARTIGEALEKGDATARGLLPYEKRWRRLMGPEIRWGYRLRQVCERLPEPVIEQLHRALRIPGLRNLVLASAVSFDWHSAPLLGVLGRVQRWAGLPGEA